MTRHRGQPDAPELMLVNGEPASSISALDRGLHYGDGLFETIACCGGRARFLTLHLERLTHGCQHLNIALGDPAPVRAEVESLAARQDRALIKLMVTRGEAIARGYGYSGTETPTRVTLVYGWPAGSEAFAESGVRVVTASIRLGENPALAGLKHLNRLEQTIARSQANSRDATETLMYSSSGKLISGSMSNVFLVHGNRVRTPRIDLCGVAGIMRRVVLREANRAGISTEECELRASDVETADEIFLTNARIGVWPVCALDSRTFRPGDMTRKVQALLAPLLAEPADA